SIDEDRNITRFTEKPNEPETLPGKPDTSLASMGIYVFSKSYLYASLVADSADENSSHDFGKDIIPKSIECCNSMAFLFQNEDGTPAYWRDVGNIESYWQANMELCDIEPELNLYDRNWPFWTYQTQHPPAKFVFDADNARGEAIDSLVSGGCIISGARIKRSVIFFAVVVHKGSHIKDSTILPKVTIGQNCYINRAVIDKGCVIPDNTVIGRDLEEDRKRFHVTENGIILVTADMLGQHLFSNY
ncbi:MAG: sugar phosphate nucleotidyltransferase, partial [Gammaproteobacteria bacterium]|nr:sugar phosphate nucleotidyltransferase [Gammaproteobacteria bacterium]